MFNNYFYSGFKPFIFRKTFFFGLVFCLLFLCSCTNKIEPGEKLSTKDIELIRKINLLDQDEKIYKFYSEYKRSVAGNFYTNKRLATYWLDQRDTTKNHIESAFYKDVIKIDTVYFAGETFCPHLLVTRRDGSKFKVCVEGEKTEITAFSDDAISKWTQNKDK
jgi:hypothetical protein